MKNLSKKVLKKSKENKGQGVMEYMIITSLVGVLCLAAMKDFGSVVKKRIDSAKAKIVKNIDIK
jgi:Tfp pilus assembly protein PilE